MRLIRNIIVLFIVWRVLLFIPLYAGEILLPYREGFSYTNIWKFTKPYSPVDHFLLYPWANFDGVHYLSIAGEGYSHNERFFPLFPLLIRFGSSLMGNMETYGAAQFLLSLGIANVSFLASLIVFYSLLRLDFSDKTAKSTIFFLLLFPTSFFFASIYSESLFFLLILLSFYWARKKQWVLASFFGMFATATRFIGLAIFPVLLYEFVVQESVFAVFRKNKAKFWRLFVKSIPIYFVPLGLVSYMLYNLWRFDDVFKFLQNQGEVVNSRSITGLVLLPQTIFRYIKILTTLLPTQFEWWIALLEISVFAVVSILLYVAIKKRIRFSYLLYAFLSFLVPISSGTFTGLPRYILVLFPIFIALALIQNRVIKTVSIFISISLLFILLMFFSKGYYIA